MRMIRHSTNKGFKPEGLNPKITKHLLAQPQVALTQLQANNGPPQPKNPGCRVKCALNPASRTPPLNLKP